MLVDRVQDDLGRAQHRDRVLGIERFEDHLVARIVHACDAAGARFFLSDEADDQIILVVAGVGNNDVGALEAGLLENERVAPVADDGHIAFEQLFKQPRFALGFLDDNNFVTLPD